MPILARTPEQIMREEPKDLYFIEFASASGEIFPLDPLRHIESGRHPRPDDPPGRAELLAWLAEHLPNMRIEPLAPYEDSCVISGGVLGRLRLDFDEESLQVYVKRWEDTDGKPIDPRFACYAINYSQLKDTLIPPSNGDQ